MTLRLSATIILALALVSSTSIAQGYAVPERDKSEVRNHTLTMERVTRFFVTLSAITQAVKADPALKKQSAAGTVAYDAQPSLDKMSEILTRSPRIVAILNTHSFTPRTFALTEFSVFQTMQAVDAIQSGTTMAEIIAEGEANEANLKLFLTHKAELAQLEKKYPLAE